MEDFKTMFPSMDYEVIECVLRSNNGAVDATIDQLLQMSIDGQGSDDSSDSDDSIPPEVSGKGPWAQLVILFSDARYRFFLSPDTDYQ